MPEKLPNPLTDTFVDLASPQDTRLADAIVTGNTPAIAQVFKEWGVALPNVQTSVTTIMDALTKTLNIPFTPTEISMIETAAKLAAEENKNPYHSNTHFLKVFTLSAFLGADAFKDGRINAHHLSILLSAALIHDYKHDGTKNVKSRYRLENITLEASEAAMKQGGATDDDWELFKALIYTTDVVKDSSEDASFSPSDTVKKYSFSGDRDDLLPELRILADTGTVDAAMMLGDADLGGSLLNLHLSVEAGHELATERGYEYSVTGEKFFLESICYKQMFSLSGKRLIEPHMTEVLNHFGLQPAVEGPSLFLR